MGMKELRRSWRRRGVLQEQREEVCVQLIPPLVPLLCAGGINLSSEHHQVGRRSPRQPSHQLPSVGRTTHHRPPCSSVLELSEDQNFVLSERCGITNELPCFPGQRLRPSPLLTSWHTHTHTHVIEISVPLICKI